MISKDDKNALAELKASHWWNVLKGLAEARINEISLDTLCAEWFDSRDEATQAKLKEVNMRILAIREVMNLIDTNTLRISRPNM